MPNVTAVAWVPVPPETAFAVDQTTGPGTRAVRKNTDTTTPSWLRRLAEPVGQWLLGREIRARIAAFARACEDEEVLAAAQE